LFEQPDLHINERVLADKLSLPINAENFTALIASNFLTAMDAHDRRVIRPIFEEVLVATFNFQNRLVRIAELNSMLENLESGKGFSTTEIREEVKRHMDSAMEHQYKLLQRLKIFQEMRGEEDPVS
jgi:Na+/H+ antiporter NhaB